MFDYQICIADQRTPLVVFFGPRASGKKLALIRLTKYLNERGMSIKVDRSFRPSGDKQYELLCDWFEHVVASGDINNNIGHFLNWTILIKILDQRKRPICQILRLHGDWCFDADQPNFTIPDLFNYIQKISNKKIWMFFIEDCWEDQACRNLYSQRILQMKQLATSKDRIIFVTSKVDKQVSLFHPDGHPNTLGMFRRIKQQYPHFFDAFKYPPPIKWFKPYKSDFAFFSAGYFTNGHNGKVEFLPGEDFYPKQLWTIVKSNVI